MIPTTTIKPNGLCRKCGKMPEDASLENPPEPIRGLCTSCAINVIHRTLATW